MRRGFVSVWLLSMTMIASCTGGDQQQAASKQAEMKEDPGVVHVHGLGINPADGAIFAATHTGLFRIPEQGTATRVADRWQDTMGFTVVGPDSFLGSGHPDVREAKAKRLPPLLGLIESNDAGETWQSVSLQGTSDFHALRAIHDRIYGFDSTGGAFMVSAEGTTWETRSKLPLVDFAVSPTDPDVIVATVQTGVQTGVQRSDDGGRTWTALNGPPMLYLAWSDPSALWGVASSGAMFASSDAGMSWQQAGALPGKPTALLARGSTLYAAVLEDGIYASTDGGKTWQVRYKDRG